MIGQGSLVFCLFVYVLFFNVLHICAYIFHRKFYFKCKYYTHFFFHSCFKYDNEYFQFVYFHSTLLCKGLVVIYIDNNANITGYTCEKLNPLSLDTGFACS